MIGSTTWLLDSELKSAEKNAAISNFARRDEVLVMVQSIGGALVEFTEVGGN